jgi:hypothetical protein
MGPRGRITFDNQIGNSGAYRNVISGNAGDGILVTNPGNVVQDNYVGTTPAGTAALANSSNGIEVAAPNNTSGGTTSAARNVISGNFNDGVLLDGGATGVVVQGNFIGTTNSGNSATTAASSTTLITATLTDNLGDTSAFSNGVTS